MTKYIKPLPETDTPLAAPFWEGTAKGELKIRKCNSCGNHQFPPRDMCSHCHAMEFEWVQASGKGKLLTYSITSMPVHPGFKDDVPYAVVIVELEEGARMLGVATNVQPDELKFDMPMAAVFNKVTEDVTLVNWEPIAG